MKLIFTMIFTIAGGLASHQVRKVIDKYFQSDTYGRLACYSFGYLATQPFSLALFIEMDEEPRRRHIIASVLAGALFGVGVIGGYLLDEVSQ